MVVSEGEKHGCSKFNILKRIKAYHGCGKEYNVEKNGKEESNIIFPMILSLLGRISSGKKGRDRKLGGRKSRFKNGNVKNIKLYGT